MVYVVIQNHISQHWTHTLWNQGLHYTLPPCGVVRSWKWNCLREETNHPTRQEDTMRWPEDERWTSLHVEANPSTRQEDTLWKGHILITTSCRDSPPGKPQATTSRPTGQWPAACSFAFNQDRFPYMVFYWSTTNHSLSITYEYTFTWLAGWLAWSKIWLPTADIWLLDGHMEILIAQSLDTCITN